MPKQELSRKRVSSEDYDSDGGFVEDAPKHKKSKTTSSSGKVPAQLEDDDGNAFWELSQMRRVTVSEFKGKTMIGIREYYEKDGKTLPGKKGITLPLEQFNTLLQLLPDIETALQAKGISVPRPKYDASATDDAAQSSNPKSGSAKANHEATSDEDDD